MAHGFNSIHESLVNATGTCKVCGHAIYWSPRFAAWMHDPKATFGQPHLIIKR
jgi:hypothetical protein